LHGARVAALAALLALAGVGPLISTPATATAILGFWKTASLTFTDPGDNLTYTLIVNNSGTGAAQRLWVNESLPPEVVFAGDDVSTLGAPLLSRAVGGGYVRYAFGSFAPGNRSFRVFTTVRGPAYNGQAFFNVASLDFTDDVGAPGSTQWTQSLSVFRVANLTIEPRAPAQVSPSSTFDHMIWYNNTGGFSAGSILLNVTLPAGVSFVSVSGDGASGCAGAARWVNCSIALVPNGVTRSLTVRSSLGTDIPLGTFLTANATAFYAADDDGDFYTGSNASVSYTVDSPTELTLGMYADAQVMPPGGLVNFTASVLSTGTGAPSGAWLNLTLPPGATLLSATPALAQTSPFLSWSFVPPDASFLGLFTVEVFVDASLPSGTSLTVDGELRYADDQGRLMPAAPASTAVLVLDALPDIVLRLTAESASVPVGGTARAFLFLNNTGNSSATAVTLYLLTPTTVLLDTATENFTALGGGGYRFTFPTVLPGSRVVTATIRLSTGTPVGTSFFVNASVVYADDQGRALRPRSASLGLTAGAPEAAGESLGLLAVLVGAAILVWIGVGYIAFARLRRGKPRIDEVFLLHRDGLLLRHYTRQFRPEMDSDVLSGMLIAVHNFINESFVGTDWEAGEKEGLDEMKFGKYRIAICRGAHAVVAAVVSGPRTEEVHRQMRAAMDDIERDLGKVLATWDGDMAKVSSADRYVQDLLSGKYRRRR